MAKFDTEWSITNPPPEGHKDVGLWAYGLFEAAMAEKDRQGLTDRWYEAHRLYRGDHWRAGKLQGRDDRHKVQVNLLFANIQRTVANLTARNPVAEVVTSDGIEDNADQLMSTALKNWWMNTEQISLLQRSATQMEVYGPTIEKYVYDAKRMQPSVIVVDPFSWFPAPGNYADIQDMPYHCFADAISVEEVETMFNVAGVDPDDTYSLLGEDREENVPIPSGSRYGSGNAPGNFSQTMHPVKASKDYRTARALVIEIWLRDPTQETVLIEDTTNPRSGAVTYGEETRDRYPGRIRKITITNRGNLVLDDSPNPNINPAIPAEMVKDSYAWDNFPCAKACSYEDTTSVWGFSASEQVGDLQFKINELLSRIKQYIDLTCSPPLILPKDTGLDKFKFSNRAGLVIRPASTAVSQGIRFLQVPNLPSNFFEVLNLYLGFFDRIFAIQDVDRGETPRNIQAASAIVTLQERNAVLMRHKIRACDYLVRERGRWAISFFQNFGWKQESITVNDTPKMFRGVDYVGRKFNYVVESGSTITKTSLQVMEDAKELYKGGVIDRQALLEALNFPNWKAILERTAESQLDQALQLLIQAGLPQDYAIQLKTFLMQTQGGPENVSQQPVGQQTPEAGMPRAQQGQIPSAQDIAQQQRFSQQLTQ
jgi:hypothetical protein